MRIELYGDFDASGRRSWYRSISYDHEHKLFMVSRRRLVLRDLEYQRRSKLAGRSWRRGNIRPTYRNDRRILPFHRKPSHRAASRQS